MRRVTVPEFEIGAIHREAEKAQCLLRLMIANKLATLCVAMGVEDGIILVPSRGIIVAGGSGPELNAYTHIGMLLISDWDLDEPSINPDASLMLPLVADARELERETKRTMSVYEVMES